MEKKSIDIDLTVPCGENEHPVRLRLWGWSNHSWKVVWNPCRDGLCVFDPLPPCEHYLKQGLWWQDRDFRLRSVSLCEHKGTVLLLVQALDDVSSSVCREAGDSLVRIGKPAVPTLIEALTDNNWEVRCGAARALGRIGDASAVPSLIEALTDNNWEVRCGAARALGRIGDASAVPSLVQALGDMNWTVRCVVAEMLGRIGDASILPVLKRAFWREKDSEVRAALREAIETIRVGGGR